MQSKISFFNRTLFRRNLTRFWPLWALPSFVGALFPLAVLTQFLREDDIALAPLAVTSAYYQVVTYALPILSLFYAVMVAVAVWSYLYNSRSVGLMHTLPVRREGLFLTGLLSGMAMMLIPYVVTGALCIVVFSCFGGFEPVGILVTILAVIGESLFYFGSATLVAFITGNLFALPVLYFIFHFLAAGLDMLVNLFANGFLFGVNSSYSGVAEFLSPTVYLIHHVGVDSTYTEEFVPDLVHGSVTSEGIGYYSSKLTAVSLENGWLIGAYALAGGVLLGLAYALYRKRRSESAGDVVAVGWMKPVFRYGVSICGSMAGGLALYAIFWGNFQSGDYYDVVPMVVAMLIAGAIAYYTASMLLAKSMRVFRGSWKGLGAMAVCVVAICGVLHFDLFGVEGRVPEAGEVEKVTLYVADNHYTFYPGEDDELLEQVREVHSAIVEDENYIIAMDENWRYSEITGEEFSAYNPVHLGYYLKSGAAVTRRYYVPMTQSRLRQEGTYDYALNRLVNSEGMKTKRYHLDDDYMPESGYIYVEADGYGSVSFGNREAQAILDGVRKDVASGACGDYNWFESDRGGEYAIDLRLEFRKGTQVYDGEIHYEYDSISVRLHPGMTHTVSALLDQNLITRGALKTHAELWPEEYLADEQYAQEMAETYGAYEQGETVVLSNEAAGIGIIGGADGPTAVYVTGG